MIRELTIEKIRNSPTLSDEKWVSVNLPDVYSKILKLTKHMNSDCEFMVRLEFINKLLSEKKICLLHFK
jgi:hypothetical protein